MTTKQIIKIAVLLSIALGSFYAFSLLGGCSMFQKRFYTQEGQKTSLKTMYELCIKAEDSTSGKGGNTRNCDELQKAITPAGKFQGFKSCAEWKQSHDTWKIAKQLDCKKLFGIGND